MSDQTPIFITCRDRLAPLEALIRWLEGAGYERLHLVDNASTFPPLVEYLDRSPHDVIRLPANLGHRSPWMAGVVERVARDEWYAVTDDDVVPVEDCPNDALPHFRSLLERYPQYVKAGFALKIDDLPATYAHGAAVRAWESQFWRRRFGENLFHAPIDTSFALYRPYRSDFEFTKSPAIRTGYPYIARHVSWYINSADPTVEERHYAEHARLDITSWHREGGFEVGELPPWNAYRWLKWRARVLSMSVAKPGRSSSPYRYEST